MFEKFRLDGRIHSAASQFSEGSSNSEKNVKNIYLSGSVPAKLYGLPKVHKDGNPMRPVL